VKRLGESHRPATHFSDCGSRAVAGGKCVGEAQVGGTKEESLAISVDSETSGKKKKNKKNIPSRKQKGRWFSKGGAGGFQWQCVGFCWRRFRSLGPEAGTEESVDHDIGLA